MTNEEAIMWQKMNFLVDSAGCTFKKYFEAQKVAIKALEKQIRYAWHDLRKNPEDLPKEKSDLHIVFASGGQALVTYFPNAKYKYSSICYSDDDEGYVNYTDVIKWRYIEPSEEAEHETV